MNNKIILKFMQEEKMTLDNFDHLLPIAKEENKVASFTGRFLNQLILTNE